MLATEPIKEGIVGLVDQAIGCILNVVVEFVGRPAVGQLLVPQLSFTEPGEKVERALVKRDHDGGEDQERCR